MDNNDLIRDKIVEWLSNETTLLEVECEAAGDGLMSLIAPELEKAQFLDDIIKRVDDKGCYEETGAGTSWCVLADTCDGKMWCRGIEAAFLTKRGVKDAITK